MLSSNVPNSTQSIHSSDLPPQEYLNRSCASRSRSVSCFTATIPTFDFTSFVTDYQQSPWLSQPQSLRLPTPTNTPQSSQDHESDFVLFPSQTTNSPQARRISELSPATSRTRPNHQSHLGSPAINDHNQQLIQQRRYSTQQPATSSPAISVSPLPNRRVSDLIQATGLSTPATPQRSPSIGQQMHSHQYHAHSASSLNTSQAERSRPPVPRFSESTASLSQQPFEMVSFENMQGTSSSRDSSLSSESLTNFESDSDMPWNEFALPAAPGFDMAGSSIGGELLDRFQASSSSSSFPSIEHSSSTESQTISPTDMHISAPASGALTYQSTPQTDFFDSPACYSNDPSPAFQCAESPAVYDNLEYGQNFAGMQMFPSLPGDETTAVPPPEPTIKKSITMSREVSSPAKASPSSRPTGIKKKKRTGPLPDIIVDTNDPKAMKRARNTTAARNSRQRKQDYIDSILEERELWRSRAYAAGYVDDENEEQ